jgi:hypothetical protein
VFSDQHSLLHDEQQPVKSRGTKNWISCVKSIVYKLRRGRKSLAIFQISITAWPQIALFT